MNNNDVKKILDDLYALDPALRNQEKELTTIIRTMAIKPQAQYDPSFAATLRTKLLAELAQNKQIKNYSLSTIFMTQSFRYAMLGVAVIAIGAVAFLGLQPKTGGPVALNASNVAITNVGANAFGTLSSLNAGTSNQAAAANTGAAATNLAAPMSAAAVPGAASTNYIISPAHPISPIGPVTPPSHIAMAQYVYTGEPFAQDQMQLNVLKQVAQPLSADAATTALEKAGFGQINLSTFDNLSMSTVTLAENQSFGYSISIDFTDGTISIDQNYSEWPQNTATTTPLTASEIPSDSVVIATANQFLTSHDISTVTYGTPSVINNNTVMVPLETSATGALSGNAGSPTPTATAMPMIPYYSDSEQVLYPLIINGMMVYDTNGNAVGLTVEVNVRYNRVANVYGLETENYQSSAYDAITNTSTILSMAETAQTYPIFYNATENSSAIIGTSGANGPIYDLGTPTMGYAEMYQTDNQGNSDEFLVPSFIFPVTGGGSDMQTRNVVVPLITAFEEQNNGPMIPVRPTPLNSAGGSASSPVAQ